MFFAFSANPNYAFPEPGVTLRSIIWRKNNIQGDSQGNQYQTTAFEYERPSAIAIRELVPSGVFYAEGRRVSIDQIDLNLSTIEEWRLCRHCSYTSPTFQAIAQQSTCPRCGDTMWSDEGRKRKMVRLRQVMATTKARDSRIGDDRDERSPAFFTRQMLVDFDPGSCENSYVIEDETFPFGFEFLSRVTFREINFGESSRQAEAFEVAGEARPRAGFRICRHCGKVQKGNEKHTFACRIRNQADEEDFVDVLYLFREFHSEAIRFLMPVDTLSSEEKLHSFIAALQLGLKSYFKGNVDHLKTLISQEPSTNSPSLLRKPFLFLYDTVPGGTSYLRQLVDKPDDLFSLFQQALTVLRACNCDDGCYNCLYAYRNSFDQDRTSRRIARDLLNEILSRQNKLKPNPQGLSQIPLNALFDSVLEQRFIEAMGRYRYQDSPTMVRQEIVGGKAGYFVKIGDHSWNVEPQVELGIEQGVSVPSRADFIFYPTKNTANLLPIVVFTDGWQYHADRLDTDFAQRMAIAKSGNYHVWSLSWLDVESQLTKQKTKDYYANFLEQEVNSHFQKNRTSTYQQYRCEAFLPLITANSFTWLMNFLATPDRTQWTKFALVTTLAHIDPAIFKNEAKREEWQSDLNSIIDTDIWSEFEATIAPQFLGKVEWLSPNQLPLCQLYTAIAATQHQAHNPKSTLVVIWLDDRSTVIEEDRQKVWNGVLRQFNLHQFLPYSYVVTSKGCSYSLIRPTHTETASSTTTHLTAREQQWQERESLLFDETALTLLNYMKQKQWLLPEVGYELTNERGTVIAEAELAWLTHKSALVLDESDLEPFQSLGWNVATVTHVLSQPEIFRQTYLA